MHGRDDVEVTGVSDEHGKLKLGAGARLRTGEQVWLIPGHCDPTVNLHTVPNRFDFVYYSFGTITSLGAAGITPILPQARSFTIVEAILGVLYLAVLIARLMSAYRPNTRH